VGWKGGCKRGSGDGDAPLGEDFAKSVEGTLDPHASCVGTNPKGLTDLRMTLIFEKTKDYRSAFVPRQFIESAVNLRGQSAPIKGWLFHGIKVGGSEFMSLPAFLGTHGINRKRARRSV
jgi:hypothetical protein